MSLALMRYIGYSGPPLPDLYPSRLRQEIDDVNAWVTNDVNTGVYKCCFAPTQVVYTAPLSSCSFLPSTVYRY